MLVLCIQLTEYTLAKQTALCLHLVNCVEEKRKWYCWYLPF